MGLMVTLHTLKEEEVVHEKAFSGQPHIISVYGADRPGIVYMVTKELAGRKVNITDLNTQVVGSKDRPVYVMVLEVDILEDRHEGSREGVRPHPEKSSTCPLRCGRSNHGALKPQNEMAILPILKFPDPLLKEKSAPVERVTPSSPPIDDLLGRCGPPGGRGDLRPADRRPQARRGGGRFREQARRPDGNHGLLVSSTPRSPRRGRHIVREGCEHPGLHRQHRAGPVGPVTRSTGRKQVILSRGVRGGGDPARGGPPDGIPFLTVAS
jgi:predicted amino acid-binding ACT domain protein